MKIPNVLFAIPLSCLLACGGEGGEAHEGEHAGHAEHAAAAHEAEHAGHAAHAGHDEHAGHEPVAATAPSLDTSIFQLSSRFTDSTGQPFPLERLRGEPSLVVMFYGTCTTICPVLVEDAKAVMQALPPEERAHARLVLVTFDPERDTAERMIEHARSHGLDLDHTVLLRGASDGDIRELSAVLGVQYRKLPDGNFAHSAVMTLLDREGRIVERIEGLRQPNAPLVARIHQLLAPSP